MGEIKKQSINNTVLSYIGAFFAFITLYFQPKLIPAADIGLLRLMYSFSWMAAVIMPFGMGSISLRFFPQFRNTENKHNGYFLLLLLTTSLGALLVSFLLFLNKGFFVDYYKKSAYFPDYFNEAILFAYILSLVSVYTIYSNSLFKTSFTVFLTDIFTRVGQLVIIVLYHYELINRDSFVMLYILVFGAQLVLLIAYLLWLKQVSFKIKWRFYSKLNLKKIGAFGALMIFTSFASIGIRLIDQLMIGHYLEEGAVGIYATSVMICVIMEIPFNSLERIAQPKLANAWHNKSVNEIAMVYEMSSRYMFFVGAVLFCLLWSGIDLFYSLIPEKYSLGRISFYLMSLSSLINLLTGVNSSIISLSHKYFMGSVLIGIMIVVALIANNIFIEPFGITGAALATLISIGVFNILKYLYILIRFKMQPFSRHTLFITLALLLCISLILLLSLYFNPFLKAGIGSIFTIIVFSVLNIKFNTVPEINKVFRRFKIIK